MASKIMTLCMGKGFLLDKEMLDFLSGLTEEGVEDVIDVLGNLKLGERVITKRLFIENFEKIRNFLIELHGETEIKTFFEGLGYTKEDTQEKVSEEGAPLRPGKVKLISSPAFPQKKIEVRDFVDHFRSRYEYMRDVLSSADVENLSSIRKIGSERGSYTIIAMVVEKRITKNKNLFIKVEDLSGNIMVLINQNKKEVFEKAKDLLLDDIVSFNVTGTKEMLFANDIIFPEVILAEKKYSSFDECAVFSSDFHVGSAKFLEKNLLKFIRWLNGVEGDNLQRELAKKVRYLFLVGDNVDGISVFPGQEKELKILDLNKQYEKLVELLRLIRKDIKIIICPGQHDAVWIGEPQPIIGEDWAPGLYSMENVTLVPNPAWVEIDGNFKVLMYHGASMHGIIEEIPELRLKYGHDSPTMVVKEMLKRRHLAPMHGLCDYIPCKKDPLLIFPIPDIIATGDQHRSEVAVHNNILLIASSCWQEKTAFEEKVGNNPEPCKVPILNLKTREIKILDFSDDVKGGGE
ncbi:MAG: metallophosphoesterase [archaeon]|nr:metallophosphoesterase [archaeon]MCR4323835.1 metallophosphoesterase [Nanoarchaeota archaeon]